MKKQNQCIREGHSGIGSMLYDVLKKAVEEDELFLVEWESFREFNADQILGMAACQKGDRVLQRLKMMS